MDEKQIKALKETFNSLPKIVQDTIMSEEYQSTLAHIGKEHQLTEVELAALEKNATSVLMGLTSEKYWARELTRDMSADRFRAEQVANEVEKMVFTKIRNNIVELSPNANTLIQREKIAPVQSSYTILSEETLAQIDNTLDEKFRKLPAVVRDAINESEYKAIIYAIAKDQNLTIGQTDRLELSTADLMLGTISNEKFVELIQTELSISMEKAMSLVSAVNEKVLKKIRGIMMAPAPAPKLENKEHAIMKGAGIEIVNSGAPTTPSESMKPATASTPVVKLDLLEIEDGKQHTDEIKEEVKPSPVPIIGDKLAGSFQIGSTQTEHTVANLTPASLASPAVVTKPPAPKAYPPKGDPYRLSPDEEL